MTDWVNFSPKPDTKTDPIIMPAHAHAIVTGTVDFIPLSNAPKRSTTDIRVLLLKKLKKMTEIIAQNPAFIAVYPYIRRAINTTKESNMCHPLFKTSITFGSMDLSIFSIPCFSAST